MASVTAPCCLAPDTWFSSWYVGQRMLGHFLWGEVWRRQRVRKPGCLLGLCPRDPRPHLCVRADIDSRRHWLRSGRPQCPRGGRVGPDTHPHPPHSGAPQSLGGRRSGSLQAWGCRFRGCGRAETDKHPVLWSSSVLRSLGHTGDGGGGAVGELS